MMLLASSRAATSEALAEIRADRWARREGRDRKVVRDFPPGSPIKIDYDEDIALVLFCGLGDALYGLPLFAKLREQTAAIGKRLIAYVPAESNAVASSALDDLLRPTGLFDPEVEVRPTMGQMDDLLGEINARTDKGERVFVTTLT